MKTTVTLTPDDLKKIIIDKFELQADAEIKFELKLTTVGHGMFEKDVMLFTGASFTKEI